MNNSTPLPNPPPRWRREQEVTQSSVFSPQSSLVVVDYGLGNLRSVVNAFAAIGNPATLSSVPAVVRAADKVVLPGVGAAGEAMRRLRELGLDDAVREAAAAGKPTLGLCLGMQLFFDYSEENDTPCLGILPGTVRRLNPGASPGHQGGPPPAPTGIAKDSTFYLLPSTFKVPHIGWGQLTVCQPHPLLAGMDGEYIYFVHSYVCVPAAPDIVLATADYGGAFVAIAGRGNVIAVQGHPERSDVVGLGFLRRFAAWL
jgi:imidazole glycerol-phosphate synthase subunit HisH